MKRSIMTALLALLYSFAVIPAHARDFYMGLQATEGQRAWVDKGVEVIDSGQAKSIIRLYEAVGLFEKRNQIDVYVLNVGDTPFNFGPENVTAYLEDGTSVPIISFEQLAQEERGRAKRRAFAAALGAMGNAMSAAGAGYSYGSGTATAYGPGGTATAYGSWSGYDPTAAAIAQRNAQRQNEQLIADKRAADAAGRASLVGVYQISTVMPGRAKGGPITFELPQAVRKSKEPAAVTFEIVAGSEVHTVHARFTAAK